FLFCLSLSVPSFADTISYHFSASISPQFCGACPAVTGFPFQLGDDVEGGFHFDATPINDSSGLFLTNAFLGLVIDGMTLTVSQPTFRSALSAPEQGEAWFFFGGQIDQVPGAAMIIAMQGPSHYFGVPANCRDNQTCSYHIPELGPFNSYLQV